MEEQINDTSNEVVETPSTPEESFEQFLTADESSTDQPEAEQETNDEETITDEELEAIETSDTDEVNTDEESEESEEDEPEEETFVVKAAGEEIEVSKADLIKSYQMEADYTKKSQKLSEQRKVLEEEAQRVHDAAQVRDVYAQKLAQMEAIIASSMPNQESLEELKENDPIGYAVKVAEQTEQAKKLEAVREEQAQVQAQQNQQQKQLLDSQVKAEAAKLSTKFKEFSNSTQREQIVNEIRNYGKTIGFTDNELSSVYDSRHVEVLYKANKYDKLMKNRAKTTKKVSTAPKTLNKSKSVKHSDDNVQQSRRKLQASGTQQDAVSVFEQLLT